MMSLFQGGVVSLISNPQLSWRAEVFCQGCLPYGQTMDCILSEKTAEDVFGEEEVNMQNLLGKLLRNLIADVTSQQIQAVSLQLCELAKGFIEKKLREYTRKGDWENH
jgi:hypothetical protein